MAETAKPATRTRTPRATPAKTAPAKAAEAPKDIPPKMVIDLEAAGDTKSYAKFIVPLDLKGTVAGNLYVPPGTKAVRVLIVTTEEVPPATPATA